MQVLFGLPPSERVVTSATCYLSPTGAAGTLYLTSGHLAFTTLSLASSSSSPVATPAAAAPATFCHPLSRITFMTPAFVGRSRALSCTLFDKSHVTLYRFEGAHRDDFAAAVRSHVAGTNTMLDRQLRGVAAASAAAASLKLPRGERVERAYACAVSRVVRNRRGVLYVCQRRLLFVASSAEKGRAAVAYDSIDNVELSKGKWKGEPSVRIACVNPPRRFEVRCPSFTPVCTAAMRTRHAFAICAAASVSLL